jgi:hypothetical protein
MLTQRIIIDGREFDAVIVTVDGRYQKREDLILTRASLRDLASFITQDRNLRTEQCLRDLLLMQWLTEHNGDEDGFNAFFADYDPTNEEVEAAQSMVDRGIFLGEGLRCQDAETGEDIAYFKSTLSSRDKTPRFRKLLPRETAMVMADTLEEAYTF